MQMLKPDVSIVFKLMCTFQRHDLHILFILSSPVKEFFTMALICKIDDF